MANLSSPKYSNMARPYALAAFEYARDKQQLLPWKRFLETAALVANDAAVTELLANPQRPANMLFDLFNEVLATSMDAAQKNLLHLIAQNKRFVVLPEISALFNAYYAAYEKTSSVRLVTAVAISDDYKQKISTALAKRIQREISLNCEVDPAIVGGAIIHIGDNVIDGSIRGKLSRLLQNLTG